jgi:hypothetical protein
MADAMLSTKMLPPATASQPVTSAATTQPYPWNYYGKSPNYKSKWEQVNGVQQTPAPATPAPAPAPTPAPAPAEQAAVMATEGDRRVAQPEQIYQQNAANAVPGPYMTQLPYGLEQQFRNWVRASNIPTDPNSQTPAYDTRGLWRDLGWQVASQLYGQPNYASQLPEAYRTPYHPDFSPASLYATQNAMLTPGFYANAMPSQPY